MPGKPFENGHKKRGGRRKGVPNVVTKAVKQAVLEALNDGAGAVAFFRGLKDSKRAEDRRCFAQVCARLIPTELTGPAGGFAVLVNLGEEKAGS